MSDNLYSTVLFDDEPYVCYRDTSFNNLAQFARKVTQGDYTRDSDEIMSSKIWSTFAGGIGIENNREGAHEGRCWFSTLDGTRPFQLALNPLVVTVTGVKYPLGDLGNIFYAGSATSIYAWNETTDAIGAVLATFANIPVNRGLTFNGKIYIPQGANGYETFNGTVLSGAIASPPAIDFVEWDNKLYALGTDGGFYTSLDGSSGSWSVIGQLNTAIAPRGLAIWMDRSENEAIAIITDRRMYMYDPVNGLMVATRLSFPPHPDNGLGADVWRPGEDMFISAGIQVYRYSAGMNLIEGNSGPSRDEGLPSELRGRIVDLCPEHNAMLALLEGLAVAAADPVAEFDPGMSVDDPLELGASTAASCLLAFNGYGWHPKWRSMDDSGSATWIAISSAAGAYRQWWGWGDNLYTVELSRSFSNPYQQLVAGEGAFEPTGSIDLGWYTAGMDEFDKLTSHIEINMKNATATETVTLEYRVDDEGAWTALGTANTIGRTTIPFGVITLPNGALFSNGVANWRIRLRLTMTRGTDVTQTPVMDSLVLKFIKLPLSGASHTLTIPLYYGPEGWGGRTMKQIKDAFDALIVKRGFVRLTIGDSTIRIRLTGVQGVDRIADDDRGDRTITVVHTPLENYEGNAA